GHVLVHLEAARTWTTAHGRLRGFARVDNLFDRDWVGSVIVNEGNRRYYEPGPGRGLLPELRSDWSAGAACTGGGAPAPSTRARASQRAATRSSGTAVISQ